MRRCFSRLAWLAWVVMPACLGEVTSEAPLELEADYFTGVTCTTPAVLSFEPRSRARSFGSTGSSM